MNTNVYYYRLNLEFLCIITHSKQILYPKEQLWPYFRFIQRFFINTPNLLSIKKHLTWDLLSMCLFPAETSVAYETACDGTVPGGCALVQSGSDLESLRAAASAAQADACRISSVSRWFRLLERTYWKVNINVTKRKTKVKKKTIIINT